MLFTQGRKNPRKIDFLVFSACLICVFIYSISNEVQRVATLYFHTVESLDVQTSNRDSSREANMLIVILNVLRFPDLQWSPACLTVNCMI